ncbi:SCO4402 family protein [Streptomyces sp. SLBN-115]|uniref:SCO4402 family protein n=1 Tax=Streptomyces sp. SLBN-115 TaxID=2768453 RepID=UPI00190F2675|nr:hypothetical protein [Streptomyces sp. SLBN-115]
MEELEFSELSDVDLPDMRMNVISAVEALSDREYQRRVWIERDYPSGEYFDDFTLNVNILYDDTLVLEDPAATLGLILRSREEVEAMAQLASALNELFRGEGKEKADEEYVESPLWDVVVRSASVARRIMTGSG